MVEESITPRLRRVARLSEKKVRRETGLCLVEGPQSVRELLTCAPELVREVFITEPTRNRYPEFARLTTRHEVEMSLVSEEVIRAISETVQPQGIVAVARQFDTSLDQLSLSDRPAPSLLAIFHEVRDPGNAGTVLRTADAAGADAVIFSGDSVDPFSPKVIRATAGSLFHIPLIVERSLETVIEVVQKGGLRVIAADVRGADLTEFRIGGALRSPTAWLFGNEARGLTAEDRARADSSAKVPIYGKAESLNLATAAAVCLYETAFEQRRP